jgi:hypothetical protein
MGRSRLNYLDVVNKNDKIVAVPEQQDGVPEKKRGSMAETQHSATPKLRELAIRDRCERSFVLHRGSPLDSGPRSPLLLRELSECCSWLPNGRSNRIVKFSSL